jgi:alkylation response protein AidB-like acyl-CoA dehydrogenase
LQQAATDLLMDVAGPFALADRGVDDNEHLPDVERSLGAAASYFNLRKLSIYGGANEIQRSIIAKSILGL